MASRYWPLVEQARHAAAIIRPRQVGAQVDRFAEVLQGVVIVAQARARHGPIIVGLGVDRVFGDGHRKIGFGTDQIVEVVFRHAAQEIAFVGIFVEAQQRVERAYGSLVVVFHHAAAAHPEEILPVVLRPALRRAQQRCSQHDSCDPLSHFVPYNALCIRFISLSGPIAFLIVLF